MSAIPRMHTAGMHTARMHTPWMHTAWMHVVFTGVPLEARGVAMVDGCSGTDWGAIMAGSTLMTISVHVSGAVKG